MPDVTDATTQNEAFTREWVSVQATVYSYIASSVRDFQHAEDILQSVAICAFKDFHQYDSDRPFLAWVLGIARNRVIDFLRQNQRDRLIFDEQLLAHLADASEDMHDTLAEREEALGKCLQRLQPRSRRILQMRYHRDMESQQIAKALGLTANAVFIALHRARAALVKCVRSQLSVEHVEGSRL